MKLQSVVIYGLVLLLAAPVAHAQDAATWRSYAERLGPKALVVVQLTNGTRLQGHVISVSEDSVNVLPKTRIPVPVRQLALADIQSIEARHEGWSPGAKVLASVGAVGGLAMGLVLALFAASD